MKRFYRDILSASERERNSNHREGTCCDSSTPNRGKVRSVVRIRASDLAVPLLHVEGFGDRGEHL